MSTYPNAFAWWTGDPAAVALGRDALTALDAFHKGSTDLRQAVATQQKRWGHAPSGTLTSAEWDQLLAESGVLAQLDADDPDPSRVATAVQDDASVPPAKNATTDEWRVWASAKDPDQAEAIATKSRAELIELYA